MHADRRHRIARVLRLVCAVAVIAAAPLLAQSNTSTTRPTFDELYSRGQKTNASIQTLTARFAEKTTSVLLSGAVEERGTLYVQRPSRVLMRYDEPAGKTILIDGKRMTIVVPSQRLRRTMDIGRAQDRVQRMMKSDAGDLRRIFDIQLLDRSTRPDTHEVLMLPKRKEIRETLTRLELWVPETTGLLEAMRMTFASGETKLMEFSDVVPNAAIGPEVFTLEQAGAAR